MKLSYLPWLALLAPSFGVADIAKREDALKLQHSVISASRDVDSRDTTAAANTVFTRSDIERLQPRDLLDLIQRAPGVQVQQSGGRGSTTGIFIRGTKTAQSVFLVDGQRIADASSGTPFLEWLSVDQIERVEIIRGPRSTLYGADAIGGVIQVFTRRASANQRSAYVTLGYGSEHTWERSAGLALADQTTRLSLNSSSTDSQGISRTSHASTSADRDQDAYRNNSVSLNLSHQLNSQLSLGLSVLEQRGEAEYDNALFDGLYPYIRSHISSQALSFDARPTELWSSRLELGHSENRYQNLEDDTKNRAYNYTYRDSVAWLNTLTLSDQQSLLVGTEWLEDRLHSDNAYSQNSRWNRAAFIQHRVMGQQFSTELGLRNDHNQQFGDHSTYNSALTWHLNPNNDVVLSYATGFRAPSFQDLYGPWGANPDLKPEESDSVELQWRSQLAAATRLEIATYRNTIKNLVIWQNNTTQNAERARITGLEASLYQQLGDWQASLGLNLMDPRNLETGKTLERRARRTLSLDLDRQIDDFSVGAGWQAVSSSYDDVKNQRRLAGYGLLNLRGSWQVSDEFKLSANMDNALDKSYNRAQYGIGWPDTYYYDYQELGRSLMLSVHWTPQL